MFGRYSVIVACIAVGVALLLGWITVAALTNSADDSDRVIISEIAWQGTAAGKSHEWIELYNPSPYAISLAGWTLSDSGDVNISLVGTIASEGFYLLEHSEESINNIDADQIFLGTLSDNEESLYLMDGSDSLIDSANENGGSWPAGTSAPDFQSMERISPQGGPGDSSWRNNDTVTRNGLDLYGLPINGTPGRPNSTWVSGSLAVDLSISKTAPLTATAGGTVSFNLTINNWGTVAASDVEMKDFLPNGLVYSEDNGQYPLQQSDPGTLVWNLGSVPPGTEISIQLTTTINYGLEGQVVNQALTSTPLTETHTANNVAQAALSIIPADQPVVLINAVHFSGYELQQLDEAIQLINVGGSFANLSGWLIRDNLGQAIFPEGAILQPGDQIWLTRKADSFSRQFGFEPDYEIVESMPGVPNLAGTEWHLSDDGDEVVLYDKDGFLIDALIYKGGDIDQSGWSGPAVMPYVLTGVFGAHGQILFRLRDQTDGWPVADTNTAADWTQSNSESLLGKRVQYPGWDLDTFFFSQRVSETTDLVVGVAPDNAFDLIVQEIRGAKKTLEIESLTFRSWPIATELISAANRGVSVTLLLEGDPPTGIDDQEKYGCQKLDEVGGACWFMISNSDIRVYDRYRYMHAKFIIIDRERAIISTENLSPDSFPDDDKSDGTWGRRGLVLVTSSPGVVGKIVAIWQADFDPINHADLFRWHRDDPKYGNPPPGTRPQSETIGIGYDLRYRTPWFLGGSISFEVIQAPENSLRDQDGILHVINRATQGDTILIQQLSERPHWGPGESNLNEDPNPRLEAAVAAARRGATVRLLLDEFFARKSDPVSNLVTCKQVNQIAANEHLDLRCTLANPTGLGIHNKMILVEIEGQGYSYIGSLNGTELSHKGNRELALLVQSNVLYELLAKMFHSDWPHINYLPTIVNNYIGPVNHIVISEILYDPSGSIEDDEFIELANPSYEPRLLDNYRLGDASRPEDFEDMRFFPPNTLLAANETIVIASTAAGFKNKFGFNPDFEIVESDRSVPNLIDDPTWGDPAAILRLGNSGDEVFLLDPSGKIVDAIAYGSGSISGQPSCPLVVSSGRSLERYPYWRDTNNCAFDFRDWPFPNPGSLP